jgi:hypothetical protein
MLQGKIQKRFLILYFRSGLGMLGVLLLTVVCVNEDSFVLYAVVLLW